jgi:protein ImuB
MNKRFVTIWFRHLKTDWLTRRQPELVNQPFVLSIKDHNRVIVSAANAEAEKHEIRTGMVVADARVIFPSLKIYDDSPDLDRKLLTTFAKFCIRYTPVAAIDPPDGLILDASGCCHLWGGEYPYITEIINRLKSFGYDVKAAMADTIGAAWAITHFGNDLIIEKADQESALLKLPASALRLEDESIELLYKLGLRRIESFIGMQRSVLRRRFGEPLILRIDQALGHKEEPIHPVIIPEPFQERLPCPELISTATGIEIALQKLLENLCKRLKQEEKGLRMASFKCYRIDNKIEKIEIGTNHSSNNFNHLFKLFQLKIETIEPALGIELFTLEAFKVEDLPAVQEHLWIDSWDLLNVKFAELLDRIENKIGLGKIHRYLPNEHHWPERSIKAATSLSEKPTTFWRIDKPRPIQLLSKPELIQVTAPLPDYPPMLFRYKNKIHKIKKADGPERIESEWWLQEGLHRDYYCVEDEEGNRYWLFRLGHYTNEEKPKWFIHGFFA